MNERTAKIVALSVLGVLVLGSGGALYYLNGILDETKQAKALAQADVNDAEAKRGQIQDLKEKITGNPDKGMPGLTKELSTAEERVPPLDEKEYDQLLDAIDGLRKLSSTFIEDAKYSVGTRGPQAGGSSNIARVTYELQMKGGFFNLLRFINLLESQTRFIAVSGFTISEGQDETRKTTLVPIREMKLSLNGFTRKPQRGLPGAIRTDAPTVPPVPERVPTTPLP